MDFLNKIKNQFSLVFSNVGSAIIYGLFWMYLASILEKGEYGEIGFWIGTAEIGTSIAAIGLPGLVTVFGAKKIPIIRPAYELALISSSITAVGIYIITNNIAVSILVIGSILVAIWQSELNSEKRYQYWSLFHISRRVLMVIFSLILLPFFGIDGIIWAFVISTLPSFIGLKILLKQPRKSLSILKPKFSFLSNYFLSELTKKLFWWGDKILIGSIFGFVTLGSYHLATQFVGILFTVPVALGVYLLPLESQGISNKKLKIYSIIGISALVLISIYLIPLVIDIFFENYTEAILVAQIMIIGIIPLSLITIFEMMFLGKEKPNYILYGTVLQTVIFFGLILILGNEFGLVGLAYSFLGSTIIKSVYSAIMTKILISNLTKPS